jgi:hypothetical protein
VTDERPTNPSDYAALSAGWGALMGALLVAARDKGEEPVRAAETLPLGLATFALAKMVSKEKSTPGSASRSSRRRNAAQWRQSGSTAAAG